MKTIIALTCLVAGCYMSDENLGYTAIGTPRWAVTVGGPLNDEGRAVAIDSVGDVVVGGFLSGWSPIPDPPEEDIWTGQGFITKRNASDGSEQWRRAFTSSGMHSVSGVNDLAIGPQDTIYVTGGYVGTIDFGGQTLTLPPDRGGAFVAAFSSAGDLLWLRGLGDTTVSYGIAVDAHGRVFVAGTFVSSSLQLGDQTFVETYNDADTFLVAFDALGSVVWSTAFQGAAPGTISGAGPWPTGIALAGNGDVLVEGMFGASISFGGPMLDAQARVRGFLARYSRDGVYVSSQTVGRPAPYTTCGSDIAVDAAGRIALQYVEQTDEASSTAIDHSPNVVSVLDDHGNELWNVELDNNGNYAPQHRSLTTTPEGLIVTSAWTDAPYNADDRASVTGSMEVVAFDPDGESGTATFGTRQLGGLQQTLAWSTAVNERGVVAFTGAFSGVVDFGAGGAAVGTPGQDDTDVYIVAVDPPPAVP